MSTLQPTFVVVMTCMVIVSAAFGAPPAGSEQPIPKTRAVLELAVPAGTTISVNGQSFGAQRRFEFQPLTPRKHYTYNVEVQGPGVPRTARRILLEGGWQVRWTPQVPDESRPELVVQAGHTDGIRYVVLSPDGERFLTAGSDQRAILWDLAQGRVIREFHAPPGGALTGQSGLDEPRFSADGKFIFTSARHALPNFASGGELAIWDAETGRKRTVMNVANHLGGGVISADFRVVAAQTQSASGLLLRVWSAETGRPIRDITEQVAYFSAWELRLSADGKLLAAILDSGKRVWSTETGRLLGGDEAWLAATGERLPDKSSLGGRVTPDGKHVARKEGYRSWWNLFEVATGNEVHGDFMNDRSNDVVDFNEMTDVAFTRDGRQAICTGGYSTVGTYGVGKNGKIGICDTLTGAPLRMIQTALPARIKTVNFAPTQSWLMTGLVGTSRLSPSPETS